MQRRPELVPLAEAQPLMTYQNTSPRFSLKVFMYAPGNLFFQIENLLPGFTLEELPEIASPTGRVIQARLLEEEGIEFNLLLPGDAYLHSEEDVRIPWVLAEKGPEAFLRSEGEIAVDIAASPEAKYVVRSVRYKPGSE